MQFTRKILSGILAAAMLISAMTVSAYAAGSQEITRVAAEESSSAVTEESSSIIVSTPVPTDEWAEENGWVKVENFSSSYGDVYEKTVDHIQYQLHYEKNIKIEALYWIGQPDCYYYWQIAAIGTDDPSMTVVNIPGSIDGYPVTSVGNYSHPFSGYTGAFQGNQVIEEVNIQDGVLALSDRAFYFCPNLEKVSLPNTLCMIGEHVFCATNKNGDLAANYKLKELTIPANVVRVDYLAFSGTPLETLTFLGNAPVGDDEYGVGGLHGSALNTIDTINVYSNTTGWDGYISPNYNLKWTDLDSFHVIENGEPAENPYTITIDVPSTIYVEKSDTSYQIPAVLTSNDPRYQEIIWLGGSGITADGVLNNFGSILGMTLYACCGDVCKEITVYRDTADYFPSISVNTNEVTLREGESATVTATVTNQQSYDDTPVTWSTADPSIATVENGIITGVGSGTTIVTASLGNFTQEITVTVTGTEPDPDPEEPGTDPDDPEKTLPFIDVTDPEAYYYDAVEHVYYEGLMTGLDPITFGPAQTLSRAHFAVILYRMAGSPSVEGMENPFRDNQNTSAFFYNAVIWCNNVGVITGYLNEDGSPRNLFGPSDLITREQLATMLYRYANYSGMDTSASISLDDFGDSNRVSSFAADALQWAAAEGIVSGRETNPPTIAPQDNASRADAAVMLQRYLA